MPPRSAYAGGYSEGIRRQLDSIVIPDRIKCATCKKIRMQSAFSKKQIESLRHAMVTEGAKPLSGRSPAKCRICSGNQVVELKCTVCDKTKSLEGFAKNQRGDRDGARCLACVQRHADTDPVVEEQKLLVENVGHTGETFKLTSQVDERTAEMQKLSLGPSTADDEDLSLGGGVWLEERETREGDTVSIKRRDDHDAKSEVAKSVARTSFAQSGAAGERSVMGPSSRRPPPAKRESKFARVPAQYVDDDSERPKFSLPQHEEEGVHVPSDDDDDEDDIETYI